MVKSNNLHVFDLDNIESDVELFLPGSPDEEMLVLELPDPIEPLIENLCEAIKVSPKEVPKDNKREGTVVSLNCHPGACTTRRASGNVEYRVDSILSEIIGQRIQTKALPLALRKRLMYERACGG